MKILCVGDSLSLPGHDNKYEDTWFYKLKREFTNFDFISFFKRHLTTDVLNTMGGGETFEGAYPMGADCLEHYMPSVVIIQLGIVDCAPRLINENSFAWKIIRRCPKLIIEKYINNLKKKGRDSSNVKVSEIQFRANLEKYLKRCVDSEVQKVIYIAIPVPGSEMKKKNQAIEENVIKYNTILDELANLYKFLHVIKPLNPSNGENIYEDGYHPNPNGNELVFNEISKLIHHS